MYKFDSDKIALKIKAAREHAGMTQLELADKIFLTKDAIAKWEQGKNTPPFPSIVSLANILNVDIEYFLEEDKKTMILDHLKVVNDNAAKTIIYNGVEEIIPAWKAFYQDYDNAIGSSHYYDKDCSWENENSFLILISTTTEELIAIRDFGKYQPLPVDFLFCTEYLPLFTHQPETADKLKKRAKETLELFYRETEEMSNKFEKPLFLVDYLGTNNYLAWSLSENKYIYVYDYKTYRENFKYSEINIRTMDEIKENTCYSIQPPSKELIAMISEFDLNLNEEIWNNKMSWDRWEPRAEMVPVELNEDRFKKLYRNAVTLINKGRKSDLGLDQEFAMLEIRVRMMLRLDEAGCPAEIYEKEAQLVQKSIDAIESKLK